MKPRTRVDAIASPHVVTLISLVVAAVLFAGCTHAPATQVVTSPGEIARQAGPSPTPELAPPPADETAPAESETEIAAAADDDVDVEPAEEVAISPLDELPETPPEVSPSTIEKDKDIVAEAFPGFDIPMVLNDQVVRYVEYFSHPHKEFFAASLMRSGRYVETFQTVFEEAGIPKDLVFMAHVESAFKTNAYSRAKAKGIFQFIAGTGRRYGLRIDSWVDERSDPQKSARAAAAYLKDLYGMFGDWYLALAAYNAGEGKIQRSLAQTRKSDFWSLASTRSLRAETRNYVPAILAATLIAKQPEKFGFDVEAESPLAFDVVNIEGQTDLRILARLADVDPETLREMNPHLRRGVTPPSGSIDVHVPAGLGAALDLAYAALPASDRLVLARHQVSKGESLSAIAHRYGVTSVAISNANRLGKNTEMKSGQELIIPAVVARAPDDGMRMTGGTYRVRKGETLSSIARNHRTTPNAIAAASGIKVRSPLKVGQRLSIPGKSTRSHAPVATAGADREVPSARPVVHTVRRGETLYRIADHYQVTVDQICALNRIAANGVLYPGTRLKIRTD